MRLRSDRELVGSESYESTTAGKGAGSDFRPACGPASLPESTFAEAPDGPTGSDGASDDFSTEGKTFGDMAKNIFCMFQNLGTLSKVPRSKIKFSGSIFPLPECPRALCEVLGQVPGDLLMMLGCVCKALNSYSGSVAIERPVASAAAKMAMKSLADTIRDSGLLQEKFEGVSWEKLGKVKTVDYRGEEI